MNDSYTKALIRDHEDVRYLAYLDSEGIKSIAVGMNLEEAGARERIEALELDYEAVCAGNCELTDEHVETLFEHDYQVAVNEARQNVTNFDEHPDDVQAVIVDMNFNLGGPRFRGFVNTIAAFEAKDYCRAADEMADSLWAAQTKRRAVDDIAIVRGHCDA
jgi:lysozyme